MKSIYFFALLFCTVGLVNAQTATTTWSQNSEPTMPCFSSPHAAYLNNDTILDVVVGGGYELEERIKAVSAYDGATGNPIWQQDSRGQFFGSAIFQDINGDGTDDVFINGRVTQLNAYDGANGNLLWEFYPANGIDPSEVGWYNFYNMQWIPDQDNDQLLDILIANGGDHLAPTFDTLNRPVGRLVIISGGTGALINYAEVPDGRETYLSPLVHDLGSDGILDVIYGTGGEVLYGNLWRTTVADIMSGDISNSTLLASSAPKGFIPPPTLADVNTDGELDILIGGYNGKIQAIDGVTNQSIWQVQLPNTETNASPTVGQFTDDWIPDMFISVATGTAPSFLQTIQLMINGETGAVEWQDTLGFLNFATANAIDTDQDGKDEVIVSLNYVGASFSHELMLIDFNSANTLTSITGVKPSTNLASTPWVGDLDNDGLLDIIYTHNQVNNNFAPNNGFVTERLATNYPTPPHVAFGAYMGTNYDGKYTNPYCQNIAVNINTTASPCANIAAGAINLTIVGGTAPYIFTRDGVSSPPLSSTTFNFQNLMPDTYDINITDSEGCKLNRQVVVASPPPLSLNLNLTQPSSNSASDGAIQATAAGGVGTYQLQISGNSFTNLSEGNYTITLTDANGCSLVQTVALLSVGVDTPHASAVALNIAPNPSNGELTLTLNQNLLLEQIQSLALYDANGKIVWQQNKHNYNPANATSNTEQLISIDISHLPQGLYMLQLLTNKGTYSSKVIR